MNDLTDRELEGTLRSLPTNPPPEALRQRVLTAAEKLHRPRANWRLRLALAVGLLALLLLDLGVDRVQSVRLARLVGDGRLIAPASKGSLLAFRQRDRELFALLRGEDSGWNSQTRQ